MYKLTISNPLYGSEHTCVIRISDGAVIPFDPANTDYQAYLKWVEAGGVPEAADEPA
jgi:hypothetical protein